MNLLFELTHPEGPAFAERWGKPCYCVPFDLDAKGRFCRGGFAAVTPQALGIFAPDGRVTVFPLQQLQDVACEDMVGGGVLTVTVDGCQRAVCRFSMRHLPRYGYIVRGIRLLMQGDDRPVISRERERVCPKCGRELGGVSVCPRCEGAKTSFRRLLRICKPFAPRLLVIWLLMLVAAGISLYTQQWQKLFIDRYLVPGKGTWPAILLFVGVLAALAAGTVIINLVKRYLGVALGARMSGSLRRTLFLKVQQLSLTYHDTRKPGELMNRITGDTEQVRQFMENTFTNMFTYIITFFGALVLMVVMNWKLTLVSVVFAPLAFAAFRLSRRRIHKLFTVSRKRSDRLNNRLQDVLQGIKVVKIFGRDEAEVSRFEKEAAAVAKIEEESECFWAKFSPMLSFVLNLGTVMVLLLGGVRSVQGLGFTVGEMAQYVGYAGMMFGPLGWFTMLPRQVMNLRISLSRIDDVLGQDAVLPVPEQPVAKTIAGAVEFKNVTFGYKSYQPVLENVSFSVRPGESIGLVGASGTGKSTLINLLMRLYDVDEGAVLVDGVDVREYDPACFHSQIGVVLQESTLFAGTIFDNIRFARPQATVEEVIAAAKTAGAHDFICKFPDGYQTLVGEKGQRLSGGERQRIAIARAVLGDPALLILDEATSSLDTESEFAIQQALGRLMKGRTTVAIAHRLSTLKDVDRLLVLDQHRIAQTGSHEELMAQEGIYKNLVEAQLEMHALRTTATGQAGPRVHTHRPPPIPPNRR